MIIRCPQCSATYEIPDQGAVVGRKVRCTRCTHVWRAEPVAPEAEVPVGAGGEEMAEAPPAPAVVPPRPVATAAEPPVLPSLRGSEPEEAGGPLRNGAHPVPPPRREPPPPGSRPPLGARPAFEPAPRIGEERRDPFARPGPLGSDRPLGTGKLDLPRAETPIREPLFPPPSGRPGPPNGVPASGEDDPFWKEEPRFGGVARKEPAATPVAVQPVREVVLEPKPRRGSGLGLVLLWLMLFGVIGALAGLLTVRRDDVTAALPGAAPWYQKLGFGPAASLKTVSLDFRAVNLVWTVDGKGRPALDIAGEIINKSKAAAVPSSVVFAFLDEGGAELFNWAAPVRRTPLAPGKTAKFQARIPAPPEVAKTLQIRFAAAE